MHSYLADLTESQNNAVTHCGSPLLVIAGAGSGKTRMLTHRIVHLITHHKIDSADILAVTFTRKAAGEMRTRVDALLGSRTHGTWIGTFHSACCRILFRYCQAIGYKPNFIIYNENDQMMLLKKIYAAQAIDREILRPANVKSAIHRFKNHLVTPQEAGKRAKTEEDREIAEIYRRYNEQLKLSNALDFDDIIMKTIELFDSKPDVRKTFEEKIRHLLVDEYQDINHAQYEFVKRISEKSGNLSVVGDDDQSIYGFRGAVVDKILNFERDFHDAKIIRLEENFRSTSTILEAANRVSVNNRNRHRKKLWTKKEPGEKIEVLETLNDKEEARTITKHIRQQVSKYGFDYNDIAIIYRTNDQSRSLEEALRKYVIPYQVIGGTHFYDRKEIKDIIAYGKFIVNPSDALSFQRILDLQHRLGKTTFQKLEKKSKEKGITLFEALSMVDDIVNLSHNTRIRLRKFFDLLKKYIDDSEKISAHETLKGILDETEYIAKNIIKSSVDSELRVDNINFLLDSIKEFAREAEDPSLRAFVQEVSLVADIDSWNTVQDRVALMTMHNAKGLEFPIVFIAGLEEGLIPHYNSISVTSEIEEERRLFYVGITRAEKKLFITYARNRRRAGGRFSGRPSRFLREIPKELIIKQDLINWERRWGKDKTRSQTLLRKEGKTPNLLEDYFKRDQFLEVGKKIEHPTLGRGVILNREGFGDDLKVTVQFSDNIEKKILVKYAKLTIAEE